MSLKNVCGGRNCTRQWRREVWEWNSLLWVTTRFKTCLLQQLDWGKEMRDRGPQCGVDLVTYYYYFLYLFLVVLGLCFCARAFSSCSKRGPLFIAVCGPLTIAASLVVEHRLQTRRLSSCGSRTQLLRGMWDLPRPGLEPVSPALAGRLSTTAPPGKPLTSF